MPCYTQRLQNETLTQRKNAVTQTVTEIERGLANKTVQAVVGPTGGVAFKGKTAELINKNRLTDACVYRRIISGTNIQAKLALAKSGNVNQQTLAQGAHSHDFGITWHDHKG